MEDKIRFMKEAVNLAKENLKLKNGGPFGAIVVRDGKIIGRGVNTVTTQNDPTAHAEINAIRDACHFLGHFQLEDCDIYSSCEPCPMCLSAIYWADIRMLYYANGRSDAERMGFMDKHLYHELSLAEDVRKLQTTRIAVPEMAELMKEWKGLEGKMLY